MSSDEEEIESVSLEDKNTINLCSVLPENSIPVYVRLRFKIEPSEDDRGGYCCDNHKRYAVWFKFPSKEEFQVQERASFREIATQAKDAVHEQFDDCHLNTFWYYHNIEFTDSKYTILSKEPDLKEDKNATGAEKPFILEAKSLKISTREVKMEFVKEITVTVTYPSSSHASQDKKDDYKTLAKALFKRYREFEDIDGMELRPVKEQKECKCNDSDASDSD